MRLDQFAQDEAREVFIVHDQRGDFLVVLHAQLFASSFSAGKDKSTRNFPFSALTRMFASLPWRASSRSRTFFRPRPPFLVGVDSGSNVFSIASKTRPLWLWPESRTVPPSGRLAIPWVTAFSTSGWRRSGGSRIEVETCCISSSIC